MTETCPYCGAELALKLPEGHRYVCGTTFLMGELSYQTNDCLRRQRDQLQNKINSLIQQRDFLWQERKEAKDKQFTAERQRDQLQSQLKEAERYIEKLKTELQHHISMRFEDD